MTLKLVLFRLFSLVALAVCTAMLMDYILPSPAFCGFKAGCEEVTGTAYGKPLGVPLPIWGLGAFGVFYGLALFPNGPFGKLIGPAAVVAGMCGLAFILLQVLVIRRLCPLCLIIDTSALLIAAVELGISPPKPAKQAQEQSAEPAETLARRPRRAVWGGLAVAALAAAPVWTLVKPAPPVPEQVKSHWSTGKVTVVEVTDFDCPHCRQTHPALSQFLLEQQDRVQFFRYVMPLEQHTNARPSARAYLAGVKQGKGREMGEALFATDDLSLAGCERAAESLGLDLAAYHACVSDPATDSEIDSLVGWVDQKAFPGLPLIWVEDQRLVGAQTLDAFRSALRRAERKRPVVAASPAE